MRTHEGRTSLTIVARRVERLGRLPGRRIACLSGIAWLTLDGDMRDIVLRPGESFEVDRNAPVLACALDGAPARVEVAGMAGPAHRLRSRASLRYGSWAIGAACAGVASVGVFDLLRALAALSGGLQLDR